MQMKMQMKMSQQLIMTPQLQQAIKLLQLSRAELEELIEQTLIENPVLEEGIDMDTFPNKTENSQETTETAESPEVVADTNDFETARENEPEKRIRTKSTGSSILNKLSSLADTRNVGIMLLQKTK